jgi:hypothetical protein
MPYNRGEKIEKTETLNIDTALTAVLPVGGFVKGDPIKKTNETTGREIQASTDIIAGILLEDQIFPFTKKTLNIAEKGEVEITMNGAGAVDALIAVDPANLRRFIVVTPNPAGTTYRQTIGRLVTAVSVAGDKAIVDLNFELVTV